MASHHNILYVKIGTGRTGNLSLVRAISVLISFTTYLRLAQSTMNVVCLDLRLQFK